MGSTPVGPRETPRLVLVPPLHEGEAVLVESLLRQAGFLVKVDVPFGDELPRLYVRANELEEVKLLLSDFRVRSASGNEVSIPW